jgi:acyl-CoA hydrolase
LIEFVSANEAVGLVSDNSRVYFQGGHMTSSVLLEALCRRAPDLRDVEVVHLHSEAPAPHLAADMQGHLRHNALFCGTSAREVVNSGQADYTPIFLSDVPALIRADRLHIDIAMIQVSPPDAHGFCTLGTSVDVARAAVDFADLAIAHVNPRVPRTHGDAQVPISRFAAAVFADAPLPLRHRPRVVPEAAEIGSHVAQLIPDGATLQVGIGGVPSGIVAALANHRDLGVHSEVLTEEVVTLIEAGVITNARKNLDPGVTVASFAIGGQRLLDFLNDNPAVHLRPSDYVNAPHIIRQQNCMVAINAAIEIDLSGQVCAESIGPYLYSGVGGQVDFLRGAALSPGGLPIIALPATARKGSTSRITPMLGPGAAVTTTRAHVHWVVTEFGAVNLHGLSLGKRAEALISIAHPDYRAELQRWSRRGIALLIPGFQAAPNPLPG